MSDSESQQSLDDVGFRSSTQPTPDAPVIKNHLVVKEGINSALNLYIDYLKQLKL
ncbi:MAG: hypothetical protein VKL59_01525 [Nostocaceae cyanobacterium]|nr:hypothetical protein [Nostocaceae cyanobacterium]